MLAPFEQLTSDLSGHTYDTISRIYLSQEILRDFLTLNDENNSLISELKKLLLVQFVKYFESDKYINSELIIAATYLDPASKYILLKGRKKRVAKTFIKTVST